MQQCSICLDDLEGGPTLACGHRFHAVCFARLMEESRGEHDPPCPMCRANIDAVRFI